MLLNPGWVLTPKIYKGTLNLVSLFSPRVMKSGFRIREIFACGISRILGFGMRNSVQGIRNPTNDWIRNPSSTD